MKRNKISKRGDYSFAMIISVSLLVVQPLYGGQNRTTDLLFQAARTGDLKTLHNLLDLGIDPDTPDLFGHAPIYYAVSFNRQEAVELLLASHADPNARKKDGGGLRAMPATALQYAAELGNRRIAEMLIAAGAGVDEAGPGGRTALHFAAGHLDVLQLLIAKGANVNGRDGEGASPLDEAAWRGSLDTAALLLAHGADLNAQEPRTGATPVNEAAYKGNIQLVRFLLQFRPKLEVADKNGRRPLDNAIRMGKEDCALLLLDAEPNGARPAAILARAMQDAIEKDEAAVVGRILQLGFEPNRSLEAGGTALDAAAFHGAVKSVNVLLQHGADPNVAGSNGTMPLHDAALKGFAEIATALLEHGAEVNKLNGLGVTALYSAASFGQMKAADVLLEHGADPKICSSSGKGAYQAAVANGYASVAQRLRAVGGDSCRAKVR